MEGIGHCSTRLGAPAALLHATAPPISMPGAKNGPNGSPGSLLQCWMSAIHQGLEAITYKGTFCAIGSITVQSSQEPLTLQHATAPPISKPGA